MKSLWAQPSLSRDFALLSAAVFFLLFFISGWVSYTTYVKYVETIAVELEKDGVRTDRALSAQMENANYLLTALGKEIVLNPERDLVKLAQILRAFDTKDDIYTLFSWVNPEQQLMVSSSKGVLEKPINVSDRDYVRKAAGEPWKMIVGGPVEGRASGRWVIPVAMGLTDSTGKFIGILLISIDVDILARHIGDIAKHDRINFAIIGKDLHPVTQVSNDNDFVSHVFPPERLGRVNFSLNQGGLIIQGNPFWGAGTYGYYRASSDYPYIMLLGYDPSNGNEVIRGQLWPRLLQMLVMASFFLALLWGIRARMIKPVLEMTAIAEGVAKGEVCASLSGRGPVEMTGLAMQIHRISEYIEENKRIEDELRNKMFMFKKAKEQAELDRRSKTEFLAYVCQEMRTPINTIIGAAQVMKDQLYGPIENRKYRQYAADIYATGNLLLDSAQNMLAQSKAETDYLSLDEKPVDVESIINRSLRALTEKMQVEKLGVNVKLQDPMPKLIADEFRLQQIIMNVLLYALKHQSAGEAIAFEAKVVNENRDKVFFAITASTAETLPAAELIAIGDRNMNMPYRPSGAEDLLKGQSDLSLELARVLVAMHGGVIDIRHPAKGAITVSILFSDHRVRFVES
jgi:signal transduction histidine kinase/sensor domain CHASE-containing protein